MPPNLLHHTEAVQQVLSSRPCGLVTDIDGTISEIAPRPSDALVSPLCRERLGALVGLLDLVAVVSGRPAREARKMVGQGGLVYVGDHGLERLKDGEVLLDPAALPYRDQVRSAAGALFQLLSGRPGLEGLFLEDKGVSFSFHYRACADPALARAMILEAMEDLDGAKGLRVMEARRAVELRPPLEADKGTALMALAAEFGLRGLFYLGDDHTDVSAFRALRAWRRNTGGRGLAVAVVSPGAPAEARRQADFILEGVPGVEEFLGLLPRLLPPPAPEGPPRPSRRP